MSIEEKIANPLRFFNNPIEVEKDNELSTDNKISLLKNWLDDINLRQIAESENMPDTHPTRYHRAEIERLLRKYENE